MKSSTLRKTTLLSLLGLTSSQSVTWGEPFTVDNSATAAASTEALLPASSQQPGPSLVASTSALSVSDASTFSVSLASTTQSRSTVSTPVSGSAGKSSTGASPQSTGAAAVAYKKMGVAGVLAGAAGVLLV